MKIMQLNTIQTQIERVALLMDGVVDIRYNLKCPLKREMIEMTTASQPASPFSYYICLSKHRGRRRRYGLSPPRPSPFETAVNLFDTLLLRCCSCSKSTNLTQYNTTSVYIQREREKDRMLYTYTGRKSSVHTQ